MKNKKSMIALVVTFYSFFISLSSVAMNDKPSNKFNKKVEDLTIAEIYELGQDWPQGCNNGRTLWDQQLDYQVSVAEKFTEKCSESGESFDSCFDNIEHRFLEFIDDALQTIYSKRKEFIENQANPKANLANSAMELRMYIQGLVSNRDAFGEMIFDKAFDRVMQMYKENKIPEKYKQKINLYSIAQGTSNALKDNDKLFNEFKNLKNFDARIPYGQNVCKQDKLDKVECFKKNKSFRSHVTNAREAALTCKMQSGKNCTPIVYGIKLENEKPCGSVTGTWQADASGRVLMNTLVVTDMNGNNGKSFNNDALTTFIQGIDLDLATRALNKPQKKCGF